MPGVLRLKGKMWLFRRNATRQAGTHRGSAPGVFVPWNPTTLARAREAAALFRSERVSVDEGAWPSQRLCGSARLTRG
jgi:hypothetical protein